MKAIVGNISMLFLICVLFAKAESEENLENVKYVDEDDFFYDLKAELISLGKDLKIVGEEIKLLTGFGNVNQHKNDDTSSQSYIESKPSTVIKDKTFNKIVTFLTELMSEEIANSQLIAPVEVAYGKAQYLCMSRGTAIGLRSIKHGETKIIPNEDSVDIQVTYVFNNLHVHYDVFYFQILHFAHLKGALEVVLGENEIEVVIRVPKFTTLFSKLYQKDCLVRIKDFNVKRLEYHQTHLMNENNKSLDNLSGFVDVLLKMNLSTLMSQFEAKALEQVRRSLGKSGTIICNDDEFANLILKKGGSLTDAAESEQLKRYCGG